MFTLDDLVKAEAELKRWDDAFANDRSNNPNKFEAQRRNARREVRRITDEFKRLGKIEKTDFEIIADELDRLYPNAKSQSTVIHNGCKYQIRYFAVEQSRSRKTVKEWGHAWVAL